MDNINAYASPLTLSEQGLLLFDEVVQKTFLDEFDNEYFLTKGFNLYYLYKKSVYNNSYNMVATGKKHIKNYIKSMNLQEVLNDNNKS